VVNAATGDPVRKAQIVLENEDTEPEGNLHAITDALGYFAFKDVEPGSYHLSASRLGFMSTKYGGRSFEEPNTSLSLTPGQRLRDIKIELAPQGVIAGRIVTEDGDPLPNTVVMALSSGSGRDKRELVPANRAYTNDLGEYRLYGLPPGRYYLSATYRGERRASPLTKIKTTSIQLLPRLKMVMYRPSIPMLWPWWMPCP
jgi:hypothetical protein